MKISKENPPHIVQDVANRIWGGVMPSNIEGIIYTYGDTIYATCELTKDLIVHEETHGRQQTAMGPDNWWKRYEIDLAFRYEQELEAYTNQYKYLITQKGKRVAFLYAQEFAKLLAGHMYGKCVSYNKAVMDITKTT